MTALRSRADLVRQFATQAGVSYGHAYQWMRRSYTDVAWEELDAQLRARAAMAEVQAARSLTDRDIEWAGKDDDPEADLKFLVEHRSIQLLQYGEILP